jgi:hypothetical protein
MRYESVHPAILVINNRICGLIHPERVNEYLEGGARFQGHEKVHRSEAGYFRLNDSGRCKRCEITTGCSVVRVSKIHALSRNAHAPTGVQGKPWARVQNPLISKMEPYRLSLTKYDTERDKLFVQLGAICNETYQLLTRAVSEADFDMQIIARSRLSLRERHIHVSQEEDRAFCGLLKETLERFRNEVCGKRFSDPSLQRNAGQAERLAFEYVVERCRRYRYAVGNYGNDPGPVTPEVKASIVTKLGLAYDLKG